MAHPNIATAGVTLVPSANGFAPAALAQLTPQVKSLNRSLATQSGLMVHAGRGVRDYQRGVIAATLSVAGLRGAVLAAGLGFLGGAGLVKGIEVFLGLSAQFERSLNTFQAVTHATASELKDARDEAIALGKDIKLPQTSAADAAEAMTELARGGLDVEQSMRAARGSLQLAAAAGVGFADAAKIEARAINTFQLGGDQAGKVADILANAANISTGEITDMALSLQQAGAVAQAANIPIEDTATAIAILANAGLTGSDAGTSLRTMLLRLIPQTKKAREEMASLGVETTDVNGQFLPLEEVINRYHDALVKLTPEQRAFSLQTIFGQDAIRATNILFSSGAKIFKETRVEIQRQGAAAALAAAKNKGLAGSFDALRSNVESVLIGFGKETLPGVTEFVRGINQSVTDLSKSDDAADTLRATGDAVGAAFHGAGEAIGAIAPILGAAASGAAKLTDALGGGTILAAFLAFKTGAVALRAFNAAQEKIIKSQEIIRAESVLTRSTPDERRAGAGRVQLAPTALTSQTDALAASQTRVAEATTLATAAQAKQAGVQLSSLSGKAKAAAAAQGLAAANTAVAATATAEIESIDLLVGALTGEIVVEDEARIAAEQLALSKTKLTQATLAQARASQAALDQSRAGIAVQGAGGRFISRKAIEQEAEFTRGLVKGEAAAASFGASLRATGSSALAFVGGPVGLISIGLAAVTTAFLFLGNKGKSAIEELDDATEHLAGTITDLAAAQDDLARARLAIKTTALSVDETKLNLAYAKGEVIQAQSSGSAIRLRAARLSLRRATLDHTQALDAQKKAQAEQLVTEQKTRGARFEAREARIVEQQKIVTSLNNEISKAIRSGGIGAGVPVDFEKARAEGLKSHIALLRRRADEERKETPVLSRQLELIAELEERTKRAASRGDINVILRIKAVSDNPVVSGLLLGDVTASKKSGQESITDALHNRLTEIVDIAPRFRGAGKEVGIEVARGIAEGIVTDESRAVAAMRATLAEVIKQGKEQIAASIAQAKSSLFELGAGLSEQIGSLIDAGPAARQAKALRDNQEIVRLADQRRQITRDIARSERDIRDALRDAADAREDLAERKEQIDPLRSRGLNADQKKQRGRDISRFLRDDKRAVQDANRRVADTRASLADANRALRDFNTENVITALEKAAAAQKAVVAKGIEDLIAEFESGAIGLEQFNTRLAALLQGAVPDYQRAGTALGKAFKLRFEAQLRGIRRQVRALVGQFQTGIPEITVERPREKIAAAQKATQEAQLNKQEAIRANTQEQNRLTRLVLIELRKGKSPTAAAKAVKAKEKIKDR